MTPNKSIKTPLRYPGGKSRLVKQILAMAPGQYSEYREPFLGGGSVLFALQDKKVIKRAGDSFEPLYNFWKCAKEQPGAVLASIITLKERYPVGKELWSACRLMQENAGNLEIRAACYFILNRITFSGLTLSGGYSQASFESRFKQSHIDRLSDSRNVLFDVMLTNSDYMELLHKPGNDVWIFLDPPYDIKSDNLYGKAGDGHKGFDHVKFAEECKKCKHKWLVTYNDNENIRELFKWANIKEVHVKYSMNSTAKNKVELFITNY